MKIRGNLKMTGAAVVCALLIALSALPAFAAGGITVSLRIEGIKSCLYDGSYTYTTKEKTVKASELLDAFDKSEAGIEFTGTLNGYISSINGETASAFGGYDGWLYTVNGVEVRLGITSQDIADGDKIVFYYGDPMGAGFARPVADTSRIASDGVISFTSTGDVYASDGSVRSETTPVTGMTVTLTRGGEEHTYTTDAKGVVSLSGSGLTKGSYTMQLSQYTQAGCPLVLRLPAGYKLDVSGSAVSDRAADESQAPAASSTGTAAQKAGVSASSNPETGEQLTLALALVVIIVCVLAIAISFALRKHRKPDDSGNKPDSPSGSGKKDSSDSGSDKDSSGSDKGSSGAGRS